MGTVSRIGWGLLALAVALGASRPEDELVTTDHQLMRGKVVSSTADAVVFEHTVDGKPEQVTIPVDKVDPHSFYLIRKGAVAGDASGLVGLGDYCAQHGLPTYARSLYGDAAKLDPSLKDSLGAKVDATRAGSADQILAEAKAREAQGDLTGAYERCQSVIRFYPATAAADEARKLAQQYHDEIHEHRSTTGAVDQPASATGDPAPAAGAGAGSSSAKEADTEIGPEDSDEVQVQKDLARGDQERTKGHASKTQSEQLGAYRRAQQAYQDAIDACDRLASAQVGQKVAGLDGQRKKAVDGVVAARIDAGSVLLARTDFQGAMQEANAALVVDPNSFAAKAFRARVAQASADAR